AAPPWSQGEAEDSPRALPVLAARGPARAGPLPADDPSIRLGLWPRGRSRGAEEAGCPARSSSPSSLRWPGCCRGGRWTAPSIGRGSCRVLQGVRGAAVAGRQGSRGRRRLRPADQRSGS
ncbi:unnamed protein product, partial [Symbiodinium microadriaticum]